MLRTVLLIVAVAFAQAPAKVPPPDTSARAVVAKAAVQIKEYQEALRFVLADETTTQEVFNDNGARLARRTTTGDFFLAYVEADGGWLSVRDILTVDGQPLPSRDNVRELLSRGSLARIGRQVADRNARYNLGSIARNFNEPMLALVILDDKHRDRFKFERRRVEQSPTGPVVTVAFTERDRPTLIRGSDGRQIFTKGEMVIDAATGRLLRTVITLKEGAVEASLTTIFTENEKLGLWLPSLLTERYEHTSNTTVMASAMSRVTIKGRELVVAESTYTNYRRFDVSVIIR
jgi:hypothetical protein